MLKYSQKVVNQNIGSSEIHVIIISCESQFKLNKSSKQTHNHHTFTKSTVTIASSVCEPGSQSA